MISVAVCGFFHIIKNPQYANCNPEAYVLILAAPQVGTGSFYIVIVIKETV